MSRESSAPSDLQRSLQELAASAPMPHMLTGECLSNEMLLDIMRGNPWCLSTSGVEQHLQTCNHCRELVDYAQRQQNDYKQRKEEFLALVQGTKPRGIKDHWMFHASNLRLALKPNLSWAWIAIVAVVLAAIPFVFAPSHEDPAMVDVLRRVAGLRLDDADSAQKITNELKVATLKGIRREPAELRDVRNAIDKKRDSADDATLKQRWTDASNTVTAAELVNRYEAGATASGSPDLVQNLQVTDVTVENNNAELQIQRKPQNEEEFVFVVRTAKDQVGLRNVNVSGPNGFRLQIH